MYPARPPWQQPGQADPPGGQGDGSCGPELGQKDTPLNERREADGDTLQQ